jgi:hypothetical protein
MKAIKVKLGRLTLEQLARGYSGCYPVKYKSFTKGSGTRIRLMIGPVRE